MIFIPWVCSVLLKGQSWTLVWNVVLFVCCLLSMTPTNGKCLCHQVLNTFSQSRSASQKPLLCGPGAFTQTILPFMELFVNRRIRHVLLWFCLLSPTLWWWPSCLQLCVCWWLWSLFVVVFHGVEHHPPFVYSAVDWPRLVFRGDIAGLREDSWVLPSVSFPIGCAVLLCCMKEISLIGRKREGILRDALYSLTFRPLCSHRGGTSVTAQLSLPFRAQCPIRGWRWEPSAPKTGNKRTTIHNERTCNHRTY